MNSFHKLPFILSAFMAVFVGILGFLTGVDNQTVYLRMIITIVVFYIIGRYAGKTLEHVKTELDKKNAEIELERLKQEEIEREAELTADMAQGKGQNVNLAASDEDDDGFEPLTVSRVISGKISQ